MNLILIFPDDFIKPKTVRLRGRRFLHIKDVLKAQQGKELTVGIINGKIGFGVVANLANDSVDLEVNFKYDPPKESSINLILALPRPIVLRRIISSVTSLGVKDIYLINSWRVEKSYWNSPALSKESLKEQMILGLEQAKDTILPKLHTERLFKPFVKSKLPNIIKDGKGYLAHPKAAALGAVSKEGIKTLAIGPEGGFIDKEIESFVSAGFIPFNAGERILRVETAMPYILGMIASCGK
ncbi:MAG: 16S rRNA (uracil(1498)-N(3))-methyltransferase [Candidatus Omnitrophica bacterium]|nr:16S rRNA (uracil(1498)-N(3))-methyltransferase [Candidatus Omnitrophota bacterium]